MKKTALKHSSAIRESGIVDSLVRNARDEEESPVAVNTKNKGIVITQTPFRISFFGGGTDFSDYFNESCGAVIGTAINKFVYVTINSLERFLERKIRLSYSKLEEVNSVNEIQHDIVRVILQDHPLWEDDTFWDIHTFADLPAACGMGSSSSFAVGMLNSMYLSRHIHKTPKALATEAIHIEREILKEKGGWQDQILAAYGGLNRIDFRNNSFSVTPICLSPEKLNALEKSCMLFFTHRLRSSDDVQNDVMSCDKLNRRKCLNEMMAYVEEAHGILTKVGSPQAMVRELGSLIGQAWETKKRMSKTVSDEDIDRIY